MSSTRFTSRFTDAQLLNAAIEVIESMRAEEIEESQRRFDSHRAEVGRGGIPRADSICARLCISWEKLCEMPDRTMSGRAIASAKRDGGNPDVSWVTNDQVRFALRLAAHRLGAPTITSAEYRRDRDALLRKGCDTSVLPDEEQILRKTGSWRAALAISGMPPDDALGRELERLIDVDAVLDLALEAHGMIPTRNELQAFARANELALPDRITPYPAVVEHWRSHRLSQGFETPEYEPRKSRRPDFSARVIWEDSQRIRRGYWTEELAIAAVARFLDSRSPGEPTTRKAYVDWSRGDRDAPAASHMDRHYGGFSRIRRLAVEREL